MVRDRRNIDKVNFVSNETKGIIDFLNFIKLKASLLHLTRLWGFRGATFLVPSTQLYTPQYWSLSWLVSWLIAKHNCFFVLFFFVCVFLAPAQQHATISAVYRVRPR